MNKKRKIISLFFYVMILLSECTQKASYCNTFNVYCARGSNYLQKSFKQNQKTMMCAIAVLLTGSLLYCLFLKKNTSSFFNHLCNDNERLLFNSEPPTISNENNLFNSSVPKLIIQKVELPAVPEKINCTDLVVMPNQLKDKKQEDEKQEDEKQALNILNKDNEIKPVMKYYAPNIYTCDEYLEKKQVITDYAQLFFTPQLQNKNAINKSMIKSNVQMPENVIKGKIDDYFNIIQTIVESSRKIPINPKFTVKEKFISVIFTGNAFIQKPEILDEIIDSLDITNKKEEKKQSLILKPFLVWLNNFYILSQQLPEFHNEYFIQQAMLNIKTLFTHMYTNIKLGEKKYSIEEESHDYPAIFSCMLKNAQNLVYINQYVCNLKIKDLDTYNYKEWLGKDNELIEIIENKIDVEEKIEANKQNTMNAKSMHDNKPTENSGSWWTNIKNIFLHKQDNTSHNKKAVDVFKDKCVTLFKYIIEYEKNNLNLYITLNKNNMYDALIQKQLIKINTIMERYLELLNFTNSQKDSKNIAISDKISKNITYMSRDERIKIPRKERMEMLKKIKAEKLGNLPALCKWFGEGAHPKALENVKNGKHLSKDDNNVKYDASEINDNNLNDYAVWIWRLHNKFKDNNSLSIVFKKGAFEEILRKEDELDQEYEKIDKNNVESEYYSDPDEWEEIK